MARLLELPSAEIVQGFKGTIDFYYCRGRAVARRWPRSPGHRRAPSVEAQWPAFTSAAHAWKSASAGVRSIYAQMALGTPLTNKDIFTKSALRGDHIHIEVIGDDQ